MSNPPYPYNQSGPSYYPPQNHLPPGTTYGYPNPNAPVYHPYGYAIPPMDTLHPPASPQVHQPTSPRMRAQASPRMHAQSSPRMNGAGRGGGYARTNAPVYHQPNYHHPMPMGYHPQHYGHPAQPPPPMPYSYPQKYPHSPSVPYSPVHYPVHPTENPYAAPPWQVQAPPHSLSPLPKQLNMLPVVDANPYAPQMGYQVPPRRDDSPQMDQLPVPTPPVGPSPQQQTHESPRPVTVPSEQAPSETPPVEPAQASLPAISVVSAPDIPPPPTREESPIEGLQTVIEEEPTVDEEVESSDAPAVSNEEQGPAPVEAARGKPNFMSDELAPESDTGVAGSVGHPSDDQEQGGGWVIWSRRPTDPTLAPGIIFSTRARVRSDLVQKTIGEAMDDITPPSSPALKFSVLPLGRRAAQAAGDVADDAATDAGLTEASVETQPPSSSATETELTSEPNTPTPGSPVSSYTSISVSPAAVPAKVPPTEAAIISAPVQPSLSAPVQPSPAPAPAPTTTTPTITKAEAVAAEQPPAPVAAAPAVPVAKPLTKSWASLLRTSEGSSKSALPTSNVVGFSIPAGAPTTPAASGTQASSSSLPLPAGARSEVLNLLARPPDGFSGWGPKIRPRGLVNSGNMCFANAVLQTLVYCPPFYRLFGELGRALPGPVVGREKDKDGRTPLVDATIQFLREFDVKEPKPQQGKGKAREETSDDADWGVDSLMPTYVYDAMKENKRFETMRGGQQEDAEEFLGFYLDTLEEELLTIHAALSPASETKVEEAPAPDAGWMEVGKKNKMVVTRTAKSTESPITRIFGGKFRSTLRAPHQKDSVMVEDWRSLQLDIQPESVHTIKDALSHLSHPQSVQITSPTRPGQVIDATQTVLIDSLPPILVLHLKRFLYDTNVKDVVKIGKKVTFDRELEIGPDVMAPSSRGVGRPTKYKLFGVLYHHGQSASGGHYTLDVLHPNRELSANPREAWIRIDDELVSDVRPEDVFGGQERDNQCAYLLFYRRVGGGHPTKS